MTDSRTQEIRLGQSVNLAWEYAINAHLGNENVDVDSIIKTAEEAVPKILEFVARLQASAAVEAGFPGAQVQQNFQPPQGYPPAHVSVPDSYTTAAPPPPPGGGPSPVPGGQTSGGSGSKTDQEWMDLFNNWSGYYDNRFNKKSPKSPDFKNKDTGKGLWLAGQYGNAPKWVTDRLANQQF